MNTTGKYECFGCGKSVYIVKSTNGGNKRWIVQEFEGGPLHRCQHHRRKKTLEMVAKESRRLCFS